MFFTAILNIKILFNQINNLEKPLFYSIYISSLHLPYSLQNVTAGCLNFFPVHEGPLFYSTAG